MSWWMGDADLGVGPDLRRTLQLIAEGVVEFTGFGVAVISLVEGDEVRIVTVLGPEEAVGRLSGVRFPLDLLAAELDLAERWGALRFLPGDRATGLRAGPRRFIEVVPPPGATDGWHTDDRLSGLLRDEEGRLRGLLSVDLPVDGRRPDEQQRHTLQTYVRLAERALATELDRSSIERQAERSHLVAEHRRDLLEVLGRELEGATTAIAVTAADVVKGHPEGETVDRALDLVRRAAARVRRVSAGVSELAALEQPGRPRAQDAVALRHLVADQVFVQSPFARRRDVDVVVQAPVEAWVRGDGTDLEHLVSNLLSNAIKYSEEGGRVVVSLDVRAGDRQDGEPEQPGQPASTVVLRVVDEGIGIPAQDQPHLFEELFRGAAPEVRARSGTGLGLAIARRVVEQHGGRLHVESTPGRGSTFVVELPALTCHAQITSFPPGERSGSGYPT